MSKPMDASFRQTAKLYLYFTLCYVVVHGLLILNKSFFWDDWIWILNPNEFRLALDEMGVVFFKAQLHLLFMQPVFVIRSIIFFCYFVGSLFFYKSLKTVFKNDPWGAFLTSLIFIALPYNIIGRSSLCTMSYSLSFAFFNIGTFLFFKYRDSQNFLYLLFSIICSTLSFNTPSFLVMYVVLYFLAAFLTLKNTSNFLRKYTLSCFLILIHAGLFFVLKLKYFPTSGAYANYNHLQIRILDIINLVIYDGPAWIFEPLFFSFFGTNIVHGNSKLFSSISWIMFYFPLGWLFFKKKTQQIQSFLAVVCISIAAILPYVMVGKKPYVYGWDSRHQLLMSLGVSMWFYFVLGFIRKLSTRNLVAGVFVLFFSFGTIRMYLSVQGQRYQDLSLQVNLINTVDTQSRGSYILSNRGQSPGMLIHDWNFYELTGMIYQSTGTHLNPVIIESHLGGFQEQSLWLTEFQKYRNRYMVKDATWVEPFYCLSLTENTAIDELTALQFLYEEYFGDSEQFEKKINGIYKIDKRKIEVADQKRIRC